MSAIAMPDKATRIDNLPAGRSRILIVDDDRFFTKVLGIILRGENFEVHSASGLAEAREILRKESFDVIISDLRMPLGDDGLTLLQQLRAEGNRVPFIMLTGYGEVENYLVAMNAGATEYLNKPVRSEELLGIVRNCLRGGNSRPHVTS